MSFKFLGFSIIKIISFYGFPKIGFLLSTPFGVHSFHRNLRAPSFQEAAVNVSQYLAVDVYAKRVSTDNDRMRVNVNQVSNNDSARCPSPPLTPLMTQLVEMGFSKKSVETAVRATGDSAEPSTIENLVAWLLEYSEECRSLDRRLTIAENNSRISNNVSNMFSNAANLKVNTAFICLKCSA